MIVRMWYYFHVMGKDKDVKGQSRNKPLFEAWAASVLKRQTGGERRTTVLSDPSAERICTRSNSFTILLNVISLDR